MAGRIRRSGTLAALAGATVALSAGLPAAASTSDSDDSLTPASTVITATSTQTVATTPSGMSLTCTNSTTSGRTPATALGAIKVSPPVFNDGYNTSGAPKPCTDSAGGTDVITTGGTWKVKFLDKKSDENTAEPGAGDRIKLVIPQGGAVDHNSFGCVVTLAPSGAFALKGTYDDVNTLSINVSNVPVSVSGPSLCTPGSATGSFSAVYTFSPGVSDLS